MKRKNKQALIFLITMTVFSVFIFLPDGDENDMDRQESTDFQAAEKETGKTGAALSEEEIRQAEQDAAKTSIWVNADDRDNLEFITLCGNGKYVVTRSSETDPQKNEETWGNYVLKENGILKLWIDGKEHKGTVSESELVLEGKAYQKTDDDLF